MPTDDNRKRFGNIIGVLMGLLLLGVLAYLVGVKTNLLQAPPDGFWTF